jgi:hypothetical protein
VIAETAEANAKIEATAAKLRNLKSIFTNANAEGFGTVLAAPGRADGGAISGPGTGTSDTAGLFRLSNGEHVLDAEDVARMGGQAGVYAFRESLYKRPADYTGYANGGAVQYAAPAPYVVSATAGAPVGDRPIMMDGTLFGVLREMANGEAQIVVNTRDSANAQTSSSGRRVR